MRNDSCLVVLTLLILASVLVTSCGRENPGLLDNDTTSSAIPLNGVSQPEPPGEIVQVTWGGEDVSFWPYTGNSFSGVGKDPINLLLIGDIDPLKIRAALMALDGDRTMFGFPDVLPFNSIWADALGNVQTAYAETGGWVGNLVQLELGSYTEVRAHLRLFKTGEPFGMGGTWILGGAHFEITIPGTAEHQVIGWELAEALVKVDLMRAGLLDPSTPDLTAVINETPYYRYIPKQIYDPIPDALKVANGLDPGPAPGPAVPIPTDGMATILKVAAQLTVVPGQEAQSFDVQFEQVIPKPFCMTGPDFFLVQGPLSLRKDVSVGPAGHYNYQSIILGQLNAVAMDMTVDPPVPVGEPFNVNVNEFQQGTINGDNESVMFNSKRIAPQDGGTEILMTWLKVSTNGRNSYREHNRCMEP